MTNKLSVDRSSFFTLLSILTFMFMITGLNSSPVFALRSGLVNEHVEDDDLVLYVNGVTNASAIGSWIPKNGFKFLLIDIIVKNKIDSPKVFTSLFKVRVSDESNYSYTGGTLDFVNGSYHFYEIELPSRDIARGIFPIQIPQNVSGLILYVGEIGTFKTKFAINLSSRKLPPDPPPQSEVVLRSNKGFNTTISNKVFGSEVRIDFLDERILPDLVSWSSEKGWKYYVANIMFTNIGNNIADFNSWYFLVKADNGFIYKNVGVISKGKEETVISEFLETGEVINAEIVYKVPETQERFMIMYGPIGEVVSLTERPTTNKVSTQTTQVNVKQIEPSFFKPTELILGGAIAISVIVLAFMLIRWRHKWGRSLTHNQ